MPFGYLKPPNQLTRMMAKQSKRLKRGAFSGIADLQAAINRFLAEANQCPKPFVWTADPDAIIEKVRRGKTMQELIG